MVGHFEEVTVRNALLIFAATVVLSVMFAPAPALASTQVTGVLASNTTWTAAGNPYIMTGDVTVPAGITLTIEAGVNIQVTATDDQGGDDEFAQTELIVHGTLTVNGSALQRVTFSGQTPSDPARWWGIRIEQGGTPSTIRYAAISGSDFGLFLDRDGGLVTVEHVHFFDIAHTGVAVTDGEPAILASLFNGTLPGSTGIRAFFSGQPIIANNVIAGFHQWGIDLNQNVPTTTYISNNTIVGANIGLHVAPEFGSSLTAIVTNNIVNSFGVGNKGIEVVSAPGVSVALSHNNVTGDPAYTGIAAGPNSLSVFPGYVSDTDYHLTSSSPMIDAGTGPANVPLVDFDDVVRPQLGGFDIGAYEFVPSVAAPTANAGPDQTFSAGGGGTANVTLTGIGSAPPGSVLTYEWLESTTSLATTATLAHSFSTGVHLLTFKVTDQYGQFGTDTVLIGVLTGGGTGTPGPAGPQGNSLTMSADTTVCTTGGVRLTIVDSLGAPIGTPQYVCNGAAGATGATGATGAQGIPGPPGASGASVAPGSILFVVKGSPAPAGYVFGGTTKHVVPGSGQIEMDIYIKQ